MPRSTNQSPPQSSPEALAVVRPFGTYRVGDLVTDPAEVARLLASEQSASVVRIQSPQER